MQPKRYTYLIKFQYLGFRYHGWQQQPDVKTLEGRVRKTLKFVFEGKKFNVISAGRTDALVSVEQTYIQLFTYHELEKDFLSLFNQNLPPDLRALSLEEREIKFNIIQHPKWKEYLYFFAFPEKIHPFAAPFMANISKDLDLDLMRACAKKFEGEKDFYSYTFRPTLHTITLGEIKTCEIIENTYFQASFFPEKLHVLKVVGKGFKRNQIRLMMGMLIDLGSKEKSVDFFEDTLEGKNKLKLEHIAPASGLILNKVELV
ncbi:MAG: tRNA pseudouridine(38-40) synthase TruA [Psychroflexus maritimus]